MQSADLSSERLERERVARRRHDEAERRVRIFNEKWRTIGIDKQALDAQVEEKRRQEEAERLRQTAYDAEVLHNSNTACMLQNKEMEERRAVEVGIVGFRRQYQQPWSQREFDLNDPDRLKKTDIADAQMTLPGLLGEDADIDIRLERQREQLREWLVQQQSDQAAERQRQRMEEEHYNQMRLEMDKKALRLQRLETERRKAEHIAINEYNLFTTEKRRHREQTSQDFKPSESMVGIPGLCPSGDRRPRPESKWEVNQFWQYQIEEKNRSEFEKKQQEARHDRNLLISAHSALLLERKQERLTKRLRQQLDSTNVTLAETHKQRPDIKRGYIYDSFFSKFNTCSR